MHPRQTVTGTLFLRYARPRPLKVVFPGKVHLYLEGATGISGMKFGPDGRLYACRAKAGEVVVIDPKTSEMKVLAKDVRPNDLVTHKGYLYFTETPKTGDVYQYKNR